MSSYDDGNKTGVAGVAVGFLLMPAAFLGSWRGYATGSSENLPQVFQEPGTPAEDQICSRPDV